MRVGGGTWYTRMLEVHVPQGVEVQLLSDPHHFWALSSVVERFVYIEDVGGSNPSVPTEKDSKGCAPRVVKGLSFRSYEVG